MKKLLQILSAAIVSTTFIGSFASAQQACNGTITLTGPDSNNKIVCNQVNDITLTCDTTVPVTTTNNQTSQSGQGTVKGNNAGGSVATGETVNVNGTNVTIGVTGCLAVAAPVAPGAGAAGGAAAAAPEQPGGGMGGAGELPNTANSPAPAIVAGSVAIIALLAVTSRLAVAAYRHLAIK